MAEGIYENSLAELTNLTMQDKIRVITALGESRWISMSTLLMLTGSEMILEHFTVTATGTPTFPLANNLTANSFVLVDSDEVYPEESFIGAANYGTKNLVFTATLYKNQRVTVLHRKSY